MPGFIISVDEDDGIVCRARRERPLTTAPKILASEFSESVFVHPADFGETYSAGPVCTVRARLRHRLTCPCRMFPGCADRVAPG